LTPEKVRQMIQWSIWKIFWHPCSATLKSLATLLYLKHKKKTFVRKWILLHFSFVSVSLYFFNFFFSIRSFFISFSFSLFSFFYLALFFSPSFCCSMSDTHTHTHTHTHTLNESLYVTTHTCYLSLSFNLTHPHRNTPTPKRTHPYMQKSIHTLSYMSKAQHGQGPALSSYLLWSIYFLSIFSLCLFLRLFPFTFLLLSLVLTIVTLRFLANCHFLSVILKNFVLKLFKLVSH